MAAESRPLSPFIKQKILERKAAAHEEPEEIEEPEEGEEDEEEEEREELPEPALAPRKSHHAIGERERSHRPRSGGSLTDRASKFFKNLGPTQTWMLIGGGLLVANHLMVPRGTSVLSKMLNAVAPAPATKPRPRLAMPAYYAGANSQAGWNRGMSPYGPWAHAAPGGPSPYAHSDSDTWGW